MRAVICPVCNGSGWWQKPNPGVIPIPCHGCGDSVAQGKGWVEVQEDCQIVYYAQYPDEYHSLRGYFKYYQCYPSYFEPIVQYWN